MASSSKVALLESTVQGAVPQAAQSLARGERSGLLQTRQGSPKLDNRWCMIAFSWQSGMPVNCSYHFRIGKKRSRILALSSGTCHCSRNSFVPLRHSPYSRNASAYSTSSSIGISWRHRQHQSTGRGKAYSRRRLGLTPNGFARKGRKGSRERNRRLRSLGFHSSTDRTTTERPARAMIPWVRYPRSGNRDNRLRSTSTVGCQSTI